MNWTALADAFVALMQALSLGLLCLGAVMSIREGLPRGAACGGDRDEQGAGVDFRGKVLRDSPASASE